MSFSDEIPGIMANIVDEGIGAVDDGFSKSQARRLTELKVRLNLDDIYSWRVCINCLEYTENRLVCGGGITNISAPQIQSCTNFKDKE